MNGIDGEVFEAGPPVIQIEVYDYETGEALVDESPPRIWLRGPETMTVELPAKPPVYMEPGWTAVDAIDGVVSKHVRAKVLNSSAPTTASGTLNFSAMDPTAPGMPYVIRCDPDLSFLASQFACSAPRSHWVCKGRP